MYILFILLYIIIYSLKILKIVFCVEGYDKWDQPVIFNVV